MSNIIINDRYVLRNQIASFKQAVHGGAKFSEENNENAKSNPLVFFPKTGNLVFSGSIPSLADLKFQFSLMYFQVYKT